MLADTLRSFCKSLESLWADLFPSLARTGQHIKLRIFLPTPNVEEGDILNGHVAATAVVRFWFEGYYRVYLSAPQSTVTETVCGLLMHWSLAVTLDGALRI